MLQNKIAVAFLGIEKNKRDGISHQLTEYVRYKGGGNIKQ